MLKKLYLHHFRSYTKQEFHFSGGLNWIVGKNGLGKTNLVEAIYLLSTGRSFRTAQLSHLIQKGAGYFYLEAEIEKEGVAQTLKLSFDGETKKVEHNATRYSHFTPLIGIMPHVLHAPDDISLVAGAPSFRRKFLNIHLSQMDPLYLRHLARYHKAMRQRNELLKKKSEVAIEPWEEMMASSAAYLMDKRAEMVEELQAPLAKHMEMLSGGEDALEIVYEHSLPLADAQALREGWKRSRPKELHVGATLSGPHRDDLNFMIGKLSAKAYASVGQKHSIIAALHLCEWDHFQAHCGEMPLMSIDDFGAHLDPVRQQRFQEKVLELGQVFLTSPTAFADVSSQVIEIGSP